VAFSPDGKALASAGHQEINFWDVTTGKNTGTLQAGEGGPWTGPKCVAISPDGKTVASGGYDGQIRLWEVTKARTIPSINGHEYDINSVTFSPDGKTLASASWVEDKSIKLWEVTSGKNIFTFRGDESDGFNSVSFSPDGKTLVSCSDNKTIKLWDVV